MKLLKLLLFLAAAALLFLFPGCDRTPDGGGRTVVMWSFACSNMDEWISRKAEIDKKLNVKIEFECVWQNEFIQKLQATMTVGEGYPDLFEWMIENNRILSADPEKSLAAPLEDYLKNSSLWRNVPPRRASWVTYGGHIYGLPHDVHPVVLIYNDTLWKKAGVDVAAIKDWDEFMAASLKLISEKKDGKPLHYALPSGDGGLGDSMWMIWQQTGAQILDQNGKPSLTSEQFQAFVAKWIAWKKTGVFTNWDWGNFGALLKNGTLCSYITPDWWVSQVNAAADDGKYIWRVRDLPRYLGGNGTQTASWGGSFLAIPKTVKDKEFIFHVIEYMQYGNPDVAIARYEAGRMVAPLSSVWNDPAFHQPDPRFGGQKLGEIQIMHAMDTPSVTVGDIFWDAVGDFNEQYTEIAAGTLSIEEGLAAAQEKAESRLK